MSEIDKTIRDRLKKCSECGHWSRPAVAFKEYHNEEAWTRWYNEKYMYHIDAQKKYYNEMVKKHKE